MNNNHSIRWLDAEPTTIEDVESNPLLLELGDYTMTAMIEGVSEYQIDRTIRFMGVVARATDDDTVLPLFDAPFRVKGPTTILKELGMTRQDLLASIHTPKNAATRVLPRHLLDAFFPNWFQKTMCWCVIADPDDVLARIEAGLCNEAERGLRASTLQGNLNTFRPVFNRFAKVAKIATSRLHPDDLVNPEAQRTLQSAAHSNELSLPLAEQSGADPSLMDTKGSSLHELRVNYANHFAKAFPKGVGAPIGSVRHLERFLAFLILVLHAPRGQSFGHLCVDDYVPHYRFAAMGDTAPVLMMPISRLKGATMLKRASTKMQRIPLYLPPLAAQCIEILIEERGISGTDLLIRGGRSRVRTMCQNVDPLFPRTLPPGETIPADYCERTINAKYYFSAHKQRHSTVQLIEQHIEQWHNQLADAGVPHYRRTSYKLMDCALTGHAAKARDLDPYGYYNTNDPDRRALLCRQIISRLWDLLTTDAGARMVPAASRAAAAMQEIDRIEEELQRMIEREREHKDR